MDNERQPQKGDVSRTFADETRQNNWRDRELRMYSDDDLGRWRDQLVQERDKPKAVLTLTPDGANAARQREIAAQELERRIGRIDTELMYRLMTELEHERAHDRADAWER